jgi:hypothetical protein
MKKAKATAIALVTALIAALCIGASSGGDQRPSGVSSQQWIGISDRAGFKVVDSDESRSVGAQLFIKTEKGWRPARVENPAHVYPVAP